MKNENLLVVANLIVYVDTPLAIIYISDRLVSYQKPGHVVSQRQILSGLILLCSSPNRSLHLPTEGIH